MNQRQKVYDSVGHFLQEEKRLPLPGEAITLTGSVDAKDTNPKDAIAINKLPLDLVPDSLKAYAALAYLEGALKYGKFNWRIAGVRSSVYEAALDRHLMKYRNGEWADPKTHVPHLANAISCLGIMLDAALLGKLNDDRPPSSLPLVETIDELQQNVIHLKELFKDHHPHQYTIADSTPQPEGTHLKKVS